MPVTSLDIYPAAPGDFNQWTASGGPPAKPNWYCALTAGDPYFCLFPNGGSLPKKDLYKTSLLTWPQEGLISLTLTMSAKYGAWNGIGASPRMAMLLKGADGVVRQSSQFILSLNYTVYSESFTVDAAMGPGIPQIGIINDQTSGNRLVDRLKATLVYKARARRRGSIREIW